MLGAMTARAGKLILQTERLVLREFVEEDAEDFYVLGSDPEIVRYTQDPGGGFRDLDHAREILISHPMADYARHGFGRWACCLREDGALIGFAGLKYLEELREVDLGYRLIPEHWGRGLATEVCRPVLRYGFDTLGLDRIIALVHPDNAASIRVLEKLGMQRDGELEDDGVVVHRYLARP